MYSKTTIKEVVVKACALRKELEKQEGLKVSISKGNQKIGRVMNVSTMPIMACGNCKECKGYCYDIKACVQYKNVLYARIKNIVMATKDRDTYFNQIDSAIARRRTNKFFRWHVAGDILDSDYFDRMVKIAQAHKDFVFWTYTKMYWIVNGWIKEHGQLPANLHVMFSEWDGVQLVNTYNMPIFSCKLKAGNKNHSPEFFDSLYKCPGNCDICKEHGRGCIAGESAYADEH